MHSPDAEKTTFITPHGLYYYNVMPFSLKNAEAVAKDLDMVDELYKAAVVRVASYQQRLANLYNRWVKPRTFQDRDLVLKRVFENTTNPMDESSNQSGKGHIL